MNKNKLSIFPLRKRSQYLIFCLVMIVLMIFMFLLAIRLGSVDMSFDLIRRVIVNKVTGRTIYPIEWKDGTEQIIWTIRTPRILTAFVVGAGLTVCGILMQVLTKNSLADPYVLGISQGASAGAVSVIIFGWLNFLGSYGIMTGAFLGAVVAILLALSIATIRNKITSTQLVLAGIAVSALFSAVTNFMIYYARTGSDKVKTAAYWMMGSLNGATWEKLKYVSIAFIICFLLIILLMRRLDVLLLGDDVASTVGVDTARLRIWIIVIATFLTGVIVSISGTIGFVGLTFPHITRAIVGAKHKRLVPAAMLVGGVFMVIADILSRVLVSPEELPIGVVSAFFGAPFFLYLIRKSTTKFGK